MNLLSSLRSKLSGQSREAFGEGERHPLTKEMISTVRAHQSSLQGTDLSHYSFERRPSQYPGAKSDMLIYDENNTVVLHGREMHDGGQISIWK